MHLEKLILSDCQKVTQECLNFYELIQSLIKEQEFLEIHEIVDEVLQSLATEKCLNVKIH